MATIITLSKEVTFEGQEYSELQLDLEALTGRDLVSAEAEAFSMTGRPATDLDKTYQACVAARAAKVLSDMILSLSAKDFAKITSMVQTFLLEA